MYYCALYLGVVEHTFQISCHLCNVAEFWCKFSVNFLVRKYIIRNYQNNIDMVLLRTISI